MSAVSDELSLFGDDAPPARHEASPATPPIADWQVRQIRNAMDARGIEHMDERKRIVEEAAGRKVESLRSLTHNEAIRVLSQIGPAHAPAQSLESSWDEREHETWIDRL